MSELRIIPADQARELREAATPGPWAVSARHKGEVEAAGGWIAGTYCEGSGLPADELKRAHADTKAIAAAPDLAYTVEQQAEQIETLSRLLAGAENAAIERAAQIKRLQEAVRDAGELAGVELIPRLINREIITEEDMQ